MIVLPTYFFQVKDVRRGSYLICDILNGWIYRINMYIQYYWLELPKCKGKKYCNVLLYGHGNSIYCE